MTMLTEEWDRTALKFLPVVSTAFSALSIILAIIMARRGTSPLGRRVFYDGQFLVSVRYPGQWTDLRDFIQPNNPEVVALSAEIGPDAWDLFDWVARNISYRLDIGEFFQFPSGTLARGAGDCEDTAILLTSLIRAGGSDSHVVLGTLLGLGHAWVEHGGEIMETTYTSARPVSDPGIYEPMIIFNDVEALELWPGALAELFNVGRNESLKRRLLAETLKTY